MNMIIGKRQIILASLVLGLGIAVYLNWQYTNTSVEPPITETVGGDSTEYGQAQYVDENMTDVTDEQAETVDAQAEADEAFFAEAKLSRQQARDEAADTLAVMLQDASLTAEQKTDLTAQATDLANSIEVEGKIENMIKAKGFDEVMVYYDTERADVILKTAGLAPEEASQIKDIILKETAIDAENISIIEVN